MEVKTFIKAGRTSFTPGPLSWDIIARAAASVASRTATTGSEKQIKRTGKMWITYLQVDSCYDVDTDKTELEKSPTKSSDMKETVWSNKTIGQTLRRRYMHIEK